ncbi:MAG TPA: FtsX-like permease family protein [Chthonomonadaceae bacterium]|nr:FtsX-like permease family protein [Chthonomonadaceae bacterium]
MTGSLNPLLYVRRNPGKTLPIAFVIVLAVTLVASIVTIVHSIDLTIFTLYGYNRYLTGITPRNALVVDPVELQKVRSLPELGRLYPTHSYQTMIKTIFGKMVFPVFGLDAAGRAELMERCGVRLVSGRMPADGAPEAVISDQVATNLGLKVGDVLSRPESQDSYAPVPIRLVGLLHGPVWLGLTSKALVDRESPYNFVGCLAFSRTRDAADQARLGEAIDRVLNKGKGRVWKFSGLVAEARSALSNLYLIMNIVIGIIVFAISFVCGLLFNIYFTQRMPEIAMLSAIGYARSQLIARAVGETVALCVCGWILGGGLTMALLLGIRETLMAPRGLLLNPIDLQAFAFTAPVPIVISLFAVCTIGLRLATLDTVSIIERRA